MAIPDLRERRLDLTWRMFATLGAPARGVVVDSAAVDPECALVLGALGAADDQRLAEITVWFARHARRSLSLTRVRTIAGAFGDRGEQALGALTTLIDGVPELRLWNKRLGSSGGVIAPPDSRRLDERVGADALSAVVRFAPGALRIRARLALGAGARSDALAALLVHGRAETGTSAWLTLSELERMTDYGKRHLLDSLPDMALVGVLDHRRTGRTHEFRVAEGVLRELDPVPRSWLAWTPRMAAALALEEAVERVSNEQTLSAVMMSQRELTPHVHELRTKFDAPAAGWSDATVGLFIDWASAEHSRLIELA